MTLVELCRLPEQEVVDFLDSFDTVLTDCDGVLWQGNGAITGSPETVSGLQKLGKKVIYVTNNSLKSRKHYVRKFHDLNFACSFDDIFTTSHLCALYLKGIGFRKKVYLFGGKGIAEELDEASIRHVGSEAGDEDVGPRCELAASMDRVTPFVEAEREDVGCVIASFNMAISFGKVASAVSFLEDRDVLFLGTSRDHKFPWANGVSKPGTGAFVAMIETASDRTATILGKPERFMFDTIQRTHRIDPARTIMVGDRCDTDIQFGNDHGLRTVLVGTGVNSFEEALRWKESGDEKFARLVPDFYVDSLGSLLPHVEKRLRTTAQ